MGRRLITSPMKCPFFEANSKQYRRWQFKNTFQPTRLSDAVQSTSYQYDVNLRRFDAFLKCPAKPADLNDKTVGQLVGWLKRKHNLSPASAEKFQDNICSLWQFLFCRRLVKFCTDVEEAPGADQDAAGMDVGGTQDALGLPLSHDRGTRRHSRRAVVLVASRGHVTLANASVHCVRRHVRRRP